MAAPRYSTASRIAGKQKDEIEPMSQPQPTEISPVNTSSMVDKNVGLLRRDIERLIVSVRGNAQIIKDNSDILQQTAEGQRLYAGMMGQRGKQLETLINNYLNGIEFSESQRKEFITQLTDISDGFASIQSSVQMDAGKLAKSYKDILDDHRISNEAKKEAFTELQELMSTSKVLGKTAKDMRVIDMKNLGVTQENNKKLGGILTKIEQENSGTKIYASLQALNGTLRKVGGFAGGMLLSGGRSTRQHVKEILTKPRFQNFRAKMSEHKQSAKEALTPLALDAILPGLGQLAGLTGMTDIMKFPKFIGKAVLLGALLTGPGRRLFKSVIGKALGFVAKRGFGVMGTALGAGFMGKMIGGVVGKGMAFGIGSMIGGPILGTLAAFGMHILQPKIDRNKVEKIFNKGNKQKVGKVGEKIGRGLAHIGMPTTILDFIYGTATDPEVGVQVKERKDALKAKLIDAKDRSKAILSEAKKRAENATPEQAKEILKEAQKKVRETTNEVIARGRESIGSDTKVGRTINKIKDSSLYGSASAKISDFKEKHKTSIDRLKEAKDSFFSRQKEINEEHFGDTTKKVKDKINDIKNNGFGTAFSEQTDKLTESIKNLKDNIFNPERKEWKKFFKTLETLTNRLSRTLGIKDKSGAKLTAKEGESWENRRKLAKEKWEKGRAERAAKIASKKGSILGAALGGAKPGTPPKEESGFLNNLITGGISTAVSGYVGGKILGKFGKGAAGVAEGVAKGGLLSKGLGLLKGFKGKGSLALLAGGGALLSSMLMGDGSEAQAGEIPQAPTTPKEEGNGSLLSAVSHGYAGIKGAVGAAKGISQFGLKTVAKRIPIIGSLFSAGASAASFAEGDMVGGFGNLASGILNAIPFPPAWAAAAAIDVGLAGREAAKLLNKEGKILEQNTTSAEELAAKKKLDDDAWLEKKKTYDDSFLAGFDKSVGGFLRRLFGGEEAKPGESKGIDQTLGAGARKIMGNSTLGDISRTSAAGGIMPDQVLNQVASKGPVQAALQAEALGGVGAKMGKTPAYAGFGSITTEMESGKKGGNPGEVSSGEGDAGGVSYGSFQLSSKTGTVNEFLKSKEGSQYAGRLQAAGAPGSAGFSTEWKKLAQENPEAFGQAQKDFITRTHYQPQVDRLRKAGIDITDKGAAVQEMILSTGTQYRNSDVLVNALKGKDVANMSQADIINAVQDYKASTTGKYFRSSDTRVQESVANRHNVKERKALLGLAAQEQAGGLTQAQAVAGAPAQVAGAYDIGGIFQTGYKTSSKYGEKRSYETHNALDLVRTDRSAGAGKGLQALEGGEVIYAGQAGGFGNLVTIKQPDGTIAKYGHLSAINVKKGDTIGRGQNIGDIGSTGQSTGEHLHLEMTDKQGKKVDPNQWVANKNSELAASQQAQAISEKPITTPGTSVAQPTTVSPTEVTSQTERAQVATNINTPGQMAMVQQPVQQPPAQINFPQNNGYPSTMGMDEKKSLGINDLELQVLMVAGLG